jgi:hypothetical protein
MMNDKTVVFDIRPSSVIPRTAQIRQIFSIDCLLELLCKECESASESTFPRDERQLHWEPLQASLLIGPV